MSFFGKVFARAAIGLAPVQPQPATEPIQPPAIEDPASYLHVEWHLQAHRPTTRPATPAEAAEAWRLAEEHWANEYRDLPEQLAAVTRRALERRGAQNTVSRV